MSSTTTSTLSPVRPVSRSCRRTQKAKVVPEKAAAGRLAQPRESSCRGNGTSVPGCRPVIYTCHLRVCFEGERKKTPPVQHRGSVMNTFTHTLTKNYFRKRVRPAPKRGHLFTVPPKEISPRCNPGQRSIYIEAFQGICAFSTWPSVDSLLLLPRSPPCSPDARLWVACTSSSPPLL